MMSKKEEHKAKDDPGKDIRKGVKDEVKATKGSEKDSGEKGKGKN